MSANPTVSKDATGTVTVALRRAGEADAEAIRAMLGRPPSTGDRRATFLVSEDGVPVGAIDVVQKPDALVIEALAVAEAFRGRGHGAALLDFAESAGRQLGLKEMRLSPALPASGPASTFFDKFGYAGGRRRLDKPRSYLSAVGVPLWRTGTAPLSRVLLYRGVWVGMALIVALGSISLSIFGRGEIRFATFAGPAAICLAAALFLAWQLGLMFVAALRHPGYGAAVYAVACVALAAAGAGYALIEKALPQLTELYGIWQGDAELSEYHLIADGSSPRMHLSGPLGLGVSKALGKFLDEHPNVRVVDLESPGGRVGEGYALFDLFRRRKLDTHVSGKCSSACTLAFLGGVERTVSQSGVLGFHQGGFPGMNATEMRNANRELELFLVRQGRVAPDFAARVAEIPHEQIWQPTHEELLAARVVHRVADK